MSASSWGCELKCNPRLISAIRTTSASSWGCELKYLTTRNMRAAMKVSLFVRLWVEIPGFLPGYRILGVSLFVRLWVEMINSLYVCSNSLVSLFVRLWVEIKLFILDSSHHSCQPLREAVSWNVTFNLPLLAFYVSLFVRLWVEIAVFL